MGCRVSARAAAWPSTNGLPTETRAYGEQIRPSAEIEFWSGKRRGQIRFGGLIPDLAAHRDRVTREANTTERHRTRRGPGRRIGIIEDAAVAGVDELTGFAVPPVDQTEAPADVRLKPVVLAE